MKKAFRGGRLKRTIRPFCFCLRGGFEKWIGWRFVCIPVKRRSEAVSFFLLENGLEGVVLEDSEVLRRKWEPRIW